MTTPASRVSSSAGATERAGAALAQDLLPGDVVLLEGDLAAGKTTLVRGLIVGLGGSAEDVSVERHRPVRVDLDPKFTLEPRVARRTHQSRGFG